MADMAEYEEKNAKLVSLMENFANEKRDDVILYIVESKQMKKLPPSKRIKVTEELVTSLRAEFGEENIQVTEGGF